MEISFNTKQLRTLCEIEARAQATLGPVVAGFLKRRLADIRSAKTIYDLVVGQPRELPERTGWMLVHLQDEHDLVFCVNHPEVPTTADGAVDWSRVSRIQIMSIGPHHG